jgi:hypothetical protein
LRQSLSKTPLGALGGLAVQSSIRGQIMAGSHATAEPCQRIWSHPSSGIETYRFRLFGAGVMIDPSPIRCRRRMELPSRGEPAGIGLTFSTAVSTSAAHKRQPPALPVPSLPTKPGDRRKDRP